MIFIFTPDCPYLPEDAVFGVKRELIAEFNQIDDSDAEYPADSDHASIDRDA